VVVDGALYVRSYNGKNSRWHQAAMQQKAGRITAVGMTKEVSFEPVNGAINDRIDDAYTAEVQEQPVSQTHDRRTGPFCDSQEDPSGESNNERHYGLSALRGRVGFGRHGRSEAQDWVGKIHQPDIKGKLDWLYKKPGYDEKNL
jgi:hypothetical protein